jgi:hypothetical protein
MVNYCQAFRMTDLKPCKKICHEERSTCLQHRSFYNKKVWKDRFLNVNKTRFLLQGLDYQEGTFLRQIQHVLEFSLKSGLITLNEIDIATLYTLPEHDWGGPFDSLTDVFVVLCGTGLVQPEWNEGMLKHVAWNTFLAVVMLGPLYTQAASVFGRLLCNPSTNPASILRLVGECFEKRFKNSDNPLRKTQYITHYKIFLSQILSLPQMRPHLLLSDERLCSYFTQSQLSVVDPRLIRELANPIRKAEKAYHKERMSMYKEGLVMAVWHPKNMERWLELGGWPLVDMMSGDEDM